MSIHFFPVFAHEGSLLGLAAMATSLSRTQVPARVSTTRVSPTRFERPVSCSASRRATFSRFSKDFDETSYVQAPSRFTNATGRFHPVFKLTPWKVEPRSGFSFE